MPENLVIHTVTSITVGTVPCLVNVLLCVCMYMQRGVCVCVCMLELCFTSTWAGPSGLACWPVSPAALLFSRLLWLLVHIVAPSFIMLGSMWVLEVELSTLWARAINPKT